MQSIPFRMPFTFRPIEFGTLEDCGIAGIGDGRLCVRRSIAGELGQERLPPLMNLSRPVRRAENRRRTKMEQKQQTPAP